MWCFFSVGHFKDFILKLLPDDLLLILVCCYWARSSSRKKQGLPFVLFVCSFHCCITEVCQSNDDDDDDDDDDVWEVLCSNRISNLLFDSRKLLLSLCRAIFKGNIKLSDKIMYK